MVGVEEERFTLEARVRTVGEDGEYGDMGW